MVASSPGEDILSIVEDELIKTIKNLNIFSVVQSIGRGGLPDVKRTPAAAIFFVSDRNTGTKPRPVWEMNFDVVTITKNLRSEKEAAAHAYSMMEAVRKAINGKTLKIPGIEPFACVERSILGYDKGKITYVSRFRTRFYDEIPVGI